MRNGVLIEEASPEELLIKQNTNSLEEAFLSLSSIQQFNKVNIVYYHFFSFFFSLTKLLF
jgi:hypothetical protein